MLTYNFGNGRRRRDSSTLTPMPPCVVLGRANATTALDVSWNQQIWHRAEVVSLRSEP